MKQLLFFLLLLISCTIGSAQVIDTAALKTYPRSVIVKVHEVASKVSLTSTEQIALADLFLTQEEELSSLIVNGASQAIIDSVTARHLDDFNGAINSQKIEAYYNAKVSPKATTLARLTAKMLQTKYNTDSVTRQYFNTMYGWKEALVEKVWLSSYDSTARNIYLGNILFTYDSLISRYINAVESSNYFAVRFHYIDSVTAVPSSRKEELSAGYFSNCMDYPNRSNEDNFYAAFNSTFNSLDDTSYYVTAYGWKIDKETKIGSDIALAGYIKTYKLSSLASQQIMPYIAQRERGVALINKVYPDYSLSKDAAIDEVFQLYQPAIDSIVSLDANLLDASQIEIAIKFADELNLSEEAVGRLREAKQALWNYRKAYKEEDPFGEYDSKVFESETLNAILSEEQYTYVLSAKYNGKASQMSGVDWEQLQLYNMDAEYGMTESVTKAELSNYHLAIFIAYYRYANNPEQQYLSIRRINEVMPDAMRLLLERWEYRTPYGDTPDIFFQW